MYHIHEDFPGAGTREGRPNPYAAGRREWYEDYWEQTALRLEWEASRRWGMNRVVHWLAYRLLRWDWSFAWGVRVANARYRRWGYFYLDRPWKLRD